MISIRSLNAWYGESHVLHGVNLDVAEGEIVSLLGRNGAGKSTTLKAVMGLVERREGTVKLREKELISLRPDEIGRMGIAFCPEHRGIFASLNVTENLMLPPRIGPGGLSLDALYELFPNLRERSNSAGTKLSGGEQQMLAIARILRTGARFLLLDEPTEGLAPVIVKQIQRVMNEIRQLGFTILLVEQNLRFAAAVAERHYLMENGVVVDQVSSADLKARSPAVSRCLGI